MMLIVKSRSEAIRIAKKYGYSLGKHSDISMTGLKLNARLLDPANPRRYVGALHQCGKGSMLLLHVHPRKG